MSLTVQNFQLTNQIRRPCQRSSRIAAVPKASEEGICKRRDALQLGLQISGMVGVMSAFPAVGPAFAGMGADDTEELAEVEIPKLEEELGSVDASPSAKGAMQAEIETIETEISQAEEDVTKGASDEQVEEEAGGIMEQINAFKAQLGF